MLLVRPGQLVLPEYQGPWELEAFQVSPDNEVQPGRRVVSELQASRATLAQWVMQASLVTQVPQAHEALTVRLV